MVRLIATYNGSNRLDGFLFLRSHCVGRTVSVRESKDFPSKRPIRNVFYSAVLGIKYVKHRESADNSAVLFLSGTRSRVQLGIGPESDQ